MLTNKKKHCFVDWDIHMYARRPMKMKIMIQKKSMTCCC